MHHKLKTYIQGIKQDAPDFTWHPSELHNKLAEVLPPYAVYGLFRDAWQREDHIFIQDELLLPLARKQGHLIEKVLGKVFIERVIK